MRLDERFTQGFIKTPAAAREKQSTNAPAGSPGFLRQGEDGVVGREGKLAKMARSDSFAPHIVNNAMKSLNSK